MTETLDPDRTPEHAEKSESDPAPEPVEPAATDALPAEPESTAPEPNPPPPASPPSPPPRRAGSAWRFATLLLLPALAGLLVHAPKVVERMRAAMAFPYELDAEEGFVYLQGVDLDRGRPIYTPIDEPPHTVGNYPPLYPAMVAATIGPGRRSLPLGRLVVALAAFALLQAAAMHVRGRTRRTAPAILAPLLLVATYEFHQWSAFARVDLPALAFTVMGMGVFANGRGRWTASCAAALFVEAAYCKQTAILAPAACCVAMLLGDRRRLAWFLIPYLGIGLGIFAWMQARTGGEFFRHLVLHNVNEMNWRAFRAVMRNEILWFHGAWIAAIVAGAASLAAARRAGRAGSNPEGGGGRFGALPHARGAIGLWAALAAASLVSFAKVGSAANYALEPLAAWAILLAEICGRLLDAAESPSPGLPRTIARRGFVAVAALLAIHVANLHAKRGSAFGSGDPDEADAAVAHAVARELLRTHGEVLSEYPVIAATAGKDVLFQPFIMSRLAREGAWDETPFVESIRAERFGAILTAEDLRRAVGGNGTARWTAAMVEAIVAAYEPVALFAHPRPGGKRQQYWLWKPKSLAPKRDARAARRFRAGDSPPAGGIASDRATA